jgi:hypothetical protein
VSASGTRGVTISRMSEDLLQAWQEAATDLEIDVRPRGDAVLVAEFGSDAGMLCAIPNSREGEDELRDRAESRGMGWSVLGPTYLRYDRDVFIDALNDWGWTGEGEPPSWYTGEPWTE